MRQTPRRPLLLLAGSVLLLAPLIGVQLATGAGRAHACSCAPPPLSEALDRASAVFSGRVVRMSGSYPETTRSTSMRFGRDRQRQPLS